MEKIAWVNGCVKVCAIFLRPFRACWALATLTQGRSPWATGQAVQLAIHGFQQLGAGAFFTKPRFFEQAADFAGFARQCGLTSRALTILPCDRLGGIKGTEDDNYPPFGIPECQVTGPSNSIVLKAVVKGDL